MKKVFFIFVFLFSFSVSILADDIIWRIEDDTLIISGEGRITDFDSPDAPAWSKFKHRIKSVLVEEGITHIGNFSFKDLQNTESVTLPSTLLSVGDYAFSGLVKLKEITVPESVVSIGINAFSYCASLKEVFIPDSVLEIGYEAFYGLASLKEVRLSPKVKTLQPNTFAYAENLEKVYLPEGLEYIDYYAFLGAKSLKEIIIPKSVTGVSTNVFGGNLSLERIIIKNPDLTLKSDQLGGEYKLLYTLGEGNFKKNNTYFDTQFKDVKNNNWFRDSVKFVYERGIMLGSGEDIFSPLKNITYLEAITLAARLHSIYYTGKAEFESADIWYQPYVSYCKENGIIREDYAEDVNVFISREEFVNLINVFPSSHLVPTNQNAYPPDVKNPSEALINFYRAGIVSGADAEHNFYPDTLITRAEVAKIVTKLLGE